MPAPIHLERRWLMDTFGCFLQYDSMSQQLITTHFTSQSFPNLFTFFPVPEIFPHRAVLRLTNSIPLAIPAARFVKVNNNEIAIQNIETARYLCSNLNSPKTSFHAENINDWEHFLSLTQEMIIGLSLLSDPDLTEITKDNELLTSFCFTGQANQAKLGDTYLQIASNLQEISKLAHRKSHEAVELHLKMQANPEEKLSVKVMIKRAIHLSTFTA